MKLASRTNIVMPHGPSGQADEWFNPRLLDSDLLYFLVFLTVLFFSFFFTI